MIPLLLAASAACAGLVPAPLPAPVRIPVGPRSGCFFMAMDGSGDVAMHSDGQAQFFGPDGALLGTTTAPMVGIGTPPQTRGWYALQTSDLAGASARVYTVAPDGTLSGETFLHDDPGVRVYQLSRDPRGGLVLVSVHEDTGGWRADLRRFSSTAALIDGPRTMTRGRGASPQSFDWGTFIANDGTILTVTQGWHVPPLRNNQLVARWFDPAGVPITPWFVALDQTVEGGVRTALPDGGAGLSGDSRSGAIRPGSTVVDPFPAWFPSDRNLRVFVYVLPDRVAASTSSLDPCEQQIEIFAPTGESCGTVHIPFPIDGAGVCNVPWPAKVGLDGSVVLERSDPKSCDLLEWPRLLGK